MGKVTNYILNLLQAYRWHLLLAFLAWLVEPTQYLLGIEEIGWWNNSTHLLYPIPLHLFLLGCCLGIGNAGLVLSAIIQIGYLLYILSAIAIGIWQHSILTRFHLALVYDTDFSEIGRFFKQYPFSSGLLSILLFFSVVIVIWGCYKQLKKHMNQYSNWRMNTLLGSALLLPFLAWCGHAIIKHGTVRVQFAFPVTLGELYTTIFEENDMNRFLNYLSKLKNTPPILQHELSVSDDKITTVVILGESATRGHLHIYGYNRPTTPKMDVRKGWIPYENVYTSAPATHIACAYMFSNMTLDEQVPFEDFLLLPHFLNAAENCTCRYITNQWGVGGNDSVHRQIFSFCDDIKHTVHGNDSELVELLKSNFNSPENPLKTTYVVQLFGSHFPFGSMSSEQYRIFHGENPTIDAYDSSILQTDDLLDQFADIVESSPTPSYILYISDHGESPHTRKIRDWKESSSWEIPCVFYFNKAYIEKYPDIVEGVRKNTKQKFQNDIVFEILLYLQGITWSDFPYENLPFDERFKTREIQNMPTR